MFTHNSESFYKLKDANKFFASMNYNFLLKDQPDKNGDSPIYLNGTISGKRSRIPATKQRESRNWFSFFVDFGEKFP